MCRWCWCVGWVYVDEGGSIGAEDVAFAIQYAVMYQ